MVTFSTKILNDKYSVLRRRGITTKSVTFRLVGIHVLIHSKITLLLMYSIFCPHFGTHSSSITWSIHTVIILQNLVGNWLETRMLAHGNERKWCKCWLLKHLNYLNNRKQRVGLNSFSADSSRLRSWTTIISHLHQ